MRLLLFLWLCCHIVGLQAACLASWQGKPLLSAVTLSDTRDKVLAVTHSDIDLIYISTDVARTKLAAGDLRVLSPPTPTGIAVLLPIPAERQDNSAPGGYCVYPKTQHKLSLNPALSALLVETVKTTAQSALIAQANVLWSGQHPQNKQRALEIYQQRLTLPPGNGRVEQAQWLTALNALQLQFNVAGVKKILARTDFTQLLPDVRTKTRLIQAQLAIYDNEHSAAIAILTPFPQQHPIALNDEINWYLLLSSAFFDLNELQKGEDCLKHITQLIAHARYEGQVSNILLANYFDNYGHFYLSRFYSQPQNYMKELSKAIDFEYSGLAVAKLADDVDQQVIILNNLGWLYKSARRFNSAIRQYLLALTLLQKTDNATNKFYIFRNLGLTYLSIGAYDKALLYLRKLQHWVSNNTPTWAAKVQCLIGTALRETGQTDEAIQQQTNCVRELLAVNSDINELTNARVELAKSIQLKARQHPANIPEKLDSLAEQIAQNVGQISNNDMKVNALLWLANYRSGTAVTTEAGSLFNQAIELSRQSADPTLLVNALIETSLAGLSAGRADADTYVSQTLDGIERIFSELDMGELGPFWSHKINHFYSRLIRYHLNNQQFELAFNLFERSRAASLRLSKINSLPPSATTDDTKIVAQLQNISQLAMALTAEQDSDELRLKLDIQRDLLQLNNNVGAEDGVLSELQWYQQNSSDYNLSDEQSDPLVTLADAQAKLSPRQLIMAYFETEQDVVLFIVSQNSLKVQTLAKSADIDLLINRAVSAVANPDSNPREPLMRLSRAIIPQGLPEKEQWLILTSGVLNQVPFAALSASYQNNRPFSLIEKIDLIQLPSLSIFLSGAAQPEQQHELDMVFFGDPLLPNDAIKPDNPEPAGAISSWNKGLDNLVWSSFEARALQTQFTETATKFYLREQANRKNLLLKQSLNARILHIASHSYFASEQAGNVGFILSDTDTEGKNQAAFVSFAELYTYSFKNQLVVINGCETALGKSLDGAGLQGIARGFLVSGADNVVATLWPISDRASATIMQQFYQQLQQGQTVATALRLSQLAMSRTPRFRHPFYWAAYNLYSVRAQQRIF